MEGLFELLLKNGAFGVLAAVGFYLYLKERKIVAAYVAYDRAYQIAETKAKVRHIHALEDLVTTVKALGDNSKNDLSVCQGRVNVLICEISTFIEDVRLERAKEEGRREITDRIQMPVGGENEPR